MKYSLTIFFLLFSAALHANESAPEPVSETSAGQEIYNNYCANACHQAPQPARLKPKQWRVVLNTMQVRMKSAGKPQLTEEQLAQILDYLSQGK